MRGPCLCGDTACPSCGPAQGYNLEAEMVADVIADNIHVGPEWVDKFALAQFIMSIFEDDQKMTEALTSWARRNGNG